ncbi:hypothetical protein ACFYST_10095 [Kitasatospora sp. NPDC004614]|uniref:hypothetical protein n=1 Tax=unclassified Kitasatospora TaxID=2633591 RepID=UPI0036AE75BA
MENEVGQPPGRRSRVGRQFRALARISVRRQGQRVGDVADADAGRVSMIRVTSAPPFTGRHVVWGCGSSMGPLDTEAMTSGGAEAALGIGAPVSGPSTLIYSTVGVFPDLVLLPALAVILLVPVLKLARHS